MSAPVAHDPEQLVRSFMIGPFPDDPYPVYDALRETAPVFRSELGLWFATSYADCLGVLRDARFGQGVGAQRLRGDDRFDDSPAFKTLAHMLPFIDPPDHTRLRKLITRAFTPRSSSACGHTSTRWSNGCSTMSVATEAAI